MCCLQLQGIRVRWARLSGTDTGRWSTRALSRPIKGELWKKYKAPKTVILLEDWGSTFLWNVSKDLPTVYSIILPKTTIFIVTIVRISNKNMVQHYKKVWEDKNSPFSSTMHKQHSWHIPKGKKQKQKTTYVANWRTHLSRGITDFARCVSAFKHDITSGRQI